MTTVEARIGPPGVRGSGSSARSQLSDISERSWKPRLLASATIATLAFALPVAAAVVVVQVAARIVRRPAGTGGLILWLVALIALATSTLWLVDRVSRRLLPLAAMLRLSLVFPDCAPSRFGVALKTGSGKALERALARATTSAEFSTGEHAAALVVGLISGVSAHDRMTRGHSERVRAYADLIGEELGLDADSRSKLHWAALLHDVGKLDVSPAILNKTEKLTDEEWQVIRSHPAAGAKWIEPAREWLGDWALAATEHHERYDGDGYPNRLGGEEISLAGRIVAVADAFDVMTAARSYKKAFPAAQARVELANNAGTQFDPAVVRAFLSISVGRLRMIMGPIAWLSGLSGMFSVGSLASAAAAGLAATLIAVSGFAAPAAADAQRHPAKSASATAAGGGADASGSGMITSGDGTTGGGANGRDANGDGSGGSGHSDPTRPTDGTGSHPDSGNGGTDNSPGHDTVPVTPITDAADGPTRNGNGHGRHSPDPSHGDPTTPTTTTGGSGHETDPTTPDDPTTPTTTSPYEDTPTTPGDTTPATTPITSPPVTTPATSPATTPVVHHAPVANADTTGTLLFANVAIDVLHNDTDADGNLDPSTLVIVSLPSSGAKSITVSNGKINVRVAVLYTGTLVFSYRVCDTTSLCAQATVTAKFTLAAL